MDGPPGCSMPEPMENSNSIRVIHDPIEMQRLVLGAQRSGRRVGLVPTMGALHAGHLSLVSAAENECDTIVVTIFVNPTQFGPNEDFDQYPRTLPTDLEQLAHHRVDFVFAPDNEAMYPGGFSTLVKPPEIARALEGRLRPDHFQGVTTVVAKLFHIAPADVAFFGQKDFQQVAVVRRMVADLNFPIRVQVCPTWREDDGLAMSSRNAYLDASQRKTALSLHRALRRGEQMVHAGDLDSQSIMDEMHKELVRGGVSSVDYAVVANPETLNIEDRLKPPVVLLVAAHVGKVRLIDNLVVES